MDELLKAWIDKYPHGQVHYLLDNLWTFSFFDLWNKEELSTTH
jgi:hypothetical protein